MLYTFVFWLFRIFFFFFFINWIVIGSITIFNVDIIIIFFIDICFSTRAQNNIQLLCININKTIIENMKIWILFLIDWRSNSIWFNQLTNLKDFILHTCVFFYSIGELEGVNSMKYFFRNIKLMKKIHFFFIFSISTFHSSPQQYRPPYRSLNMRLVLNLFLKI